MPLQPSSADVQEIISDWDEVVQDTLPAIQHPLGAAYLWKKGNAEDDYIGITLVYKDPKVTSCLAGKTGLWVFCPFDDTMRLFPHRDHFHSLTATRSFDPGRVEIHDFNLAGTWVRISEGEFE